MSFDDEEESFEHTLLVVREVQVYKIPPRSTSGGYKCGEWLQSDKIWSGRLRVVSGGTRRCEIRLEDPNSGDLFAACFVTAGAREASVETVLDSSRYFVLKIEDGHGKHAFVGLGFAERNEAFDFNVALSDHEKYAKREDEKEADASAAGSAASDDDRIDIHPAVNHRLKEGETIRINVKPKAVSGTGMISAAAVKSTKVVGLAPPPGSSKIRSPLLPPPANDPASHGGVGLLKSTSNETKQRGSDSLSDLSPLERSLPSGTGSGSAKTTAAGWAAF